jgi:hypothetical protein
MKVTKNILREMVESEINELQISEAGGWTGTKVNSATKLKIQYETMPAAEKVTTKGRELKAQLARIAQEFEGPEWFRQDTKRLIAKEIRTAIAGDPSKGEPVEDVPAQVTSTRKRSSTRSSGLLKLGSSGPEVTKLQKLLNERLVAHGKEDLKVEVTGEFDQTTDTAVRTMQGIYKITVDGIVGPATWAALKGDKTKLGDVVNKRPEKPGPMFLWDRKKNVWYLYCNHYYYNEDVKNPIYQLWIVKDGEDFHVKMESGDTWANVTQRDIDSLETAVSSAATVVDPVVGVAGNPPPPALPESYSLAKVMLLESNATPSATGTNPNQLNTERDEACRGEPILTLEDQGEAISKRIHTFKNEITKHANAMAEEGNKSFWQNSDESRGMAALAGFDQLSTELYDDLADKVKEYIVAGGATSFNETPSMMLAVKTGWQTVDKVQGKLDSFLASSERATMLRIIQRNDFPLQSKSREVVVSTDPNADQAAITAINNDLEELMNVIEFTAVVIGANSYDTRATWGGVGRMLGSTAMLASFFIPGVGQAALGLGLAKAGAGGVAAVKGVTGVSRLQKVGHAAAAMGKAVPVIGKTAAVQAGGRTAALAGAAAGGMSIGGIAATALGVDTFGDNSDEDKVMIAINAWDQASTQFYIDNSQRIIENDLDVETPTELLFTAYNQNVTSDDSAATVDEMIDQMDEFLGGSNYSIMKTQIERNNTPYSQHARQNANESFTSDRFSKLAGLLKG